MSRSPLIPLLLAAALSLGAAGCGGDDDPATTTQAAAPTTTSPAPATTTAPPATTQAAPTTATTPSTTTGDQPATTTKAPASPLSKLKDYTKGGSPASAQDAKDVRDALQEFGDALNKRDGKAVCDRTIGLDSLLKASGKGATCEKIFETAGSSAGPSKKELAQISKGAVTVKGDRATLDLNAGTPLPLRKVDGEWKIDYGAVTAAAK